MLVNLWTVFVFADDGKYRRVLQTQSADIQSNDDFSYDSFDGPYVWRSFGNT